jgi:hypothetical protein
MTLAFRQLFPEGTSRTLFGNTPDSSTAQAASVLRRRRMPAGHA